MNRALDELEQRKALQPAPGSGAELGGADNRWLTLSQFIPTFQVGGAGRGGAGRGRARQVG